MSTPTVARWGDSPVGGHAVPAACVLTVPATTAPALVESVADGLGRIHFREDAHDLPPGVRVLRRGSMVGDTLLTGTGLALLGSKLGPLSLRATVAIERAAAAEGEDRVIVSMISGDALAPEIADVVDAAVATVQSGDVAVGGPGWIRAVDVPAESAANPRTARTLGIR